MENSTIARAKNINVIATSAEHLGQSATHNGGYAEHVGCHYAKKDAGGGNWAVVRKSISTHDNQMMGASTGMEIHS